MTASVASSVCAGLVFHEERLGKAIGQPLCDQASQDVRRAAGCEAHEHAHRPGRIIKCRCDVRQSRQMVALAASRRNSRRRRLIVSSRKSPACNGRHGYQLRSQW